jgi:hypothetical protein
MSNYPSQSQDKFVLRLPDGMRDRIKAAASDNNRSMNAEIIAALEERYPAPLSQKEILYRAKLTEFMLMRLVKSGELSKHGFMERIKPVYFALRQAGLGAEEEALGAVDLEEALSIQLDVVDLFEWIDEVRDAMEKSERAASEGAKPPNPAPSAPQ